MFGNEPLTGASERAAVLALMARRTTPQNRLAGCIDEEGSALRLLEQLPLPDRLFEIDDECYSLDEMEAYLHRLEDEGITVTTVLDESYPANLRLVHDRPPALFFRGQLSDLDARSVAVVGTRNATARGLDQVRAVVHSLLAREYVIVSGLAAGIDTEAHRAALDADQRTVAVIGTGLRHAFPGENAALQRQLADEAAVLSQFWPGQGPRRWTFPQRNAVMSGFARATVVVEASETSGARIQARQAREHGRPVFLLKPLLEHRWARRAADDPGVYVVTDGAEVGNHLERLYDSPFESLEPAS